MPADYGSIVRSGLADMKFLRHKSKSSVAATTLASKHGSLWIRLDGVALITTALQRQDGSAAIGFARGLLVENQHPLPEKLLNAIRKACGEWQNGLQEKAAADLLSAMALARELSYL
jgi:hypothetical protein